LSRKLIHQWSFGDDGVVAGEADPLAGHLQRPAPDRVSAADQAGTITTNATRFQ